MPYFLRLLLHVARVTRTLVSKWALLSISLFAIIFFPLVNAFSPSIKNPTSDSLCNHDIQRQQFASLVLFLKKEPYKNK